MILDSMRMPFIKYLEFSVTKKLIRPRQYSTQNSEMCKSDFSIMLVKKKIRMFNSWFVKIINIKSCGRFFYEYEQNLVWNPEFLFFYEYEQSLVWNSEFFFFFLE